MTEMAQSVIDIFGIKPILRPLGLSVASYYRRKHSAAQKSPQSLSGAFRSLTEDEEKNVIQVLSQPRFVDRAPAEIYATLLDEGTYLCSERTMYRVLAKNGLVRERRNQLRHPQYTKPELIATGPNQVWSWDITKLKTMAKFAYLYLHVVLDIFSRYVVGWMIAEHENAKLACHLIEETYQKHGIRPGQIVLHSDRGSPMKSIGLAQLLARLDVDPSFSRPRVSNDNPFSESQFKTLKYHPGFPSRFAGIHDGLDHCRVFFPWYNNDHRHSGIAYLTPSDVHYGRADQIIQDRQKTLAQAYKAHPERFPRGIPQAKRLPHAVWINPPAPEDQPSTMAMAENEISPVPEETPVPVPNSMPAKSHQSEVLH